MKIRFTMFVVIILILKSLRWQKIIMLQIKNDLGEVIFDYRSIDKIVKEAPKLGFRVI